MRLVPRLKFPKRTKTDDVIEGGMKSPVQGHVVSEPRAALRGGAVLQLTVLETEGC